MPTLLLDLDGTLVDSVPDLAAALNRLMASRGLAPLTLAETAAMVGDGVRAWSRAPSPPAAACRTRPRWPTTPPITAPATRRRRGSIPAWRRRWRRWPPAAGGSRSAPTSRRRRRARCWTRSAWRDVRRDRRRRQFPGAQAGPAASAGHARRRRRHAGRRGDGGRPVQRRAGGARRRPALHLRRLGLWPAEMGLPAEATAARFAELPALAAALLARR